jgi:multidrug efflux pump subunit AcrA (membrane-fusion protein)
MLLVVAAAAGGAYAYFQIPPTSLVLTGVVTTNDVIVSPQIAGQIGELRVAEGDTVGTGDVLVVIE